VLRAPVGRHLGALESVSSVQISTARPPIDRAIVKVGERRRRPLY